MIVAATAIAGNSTAAHAAADVAITITRMAVVQTEFTCTASPTGVCNYLILTSLCNDNLLAGGVKEKKCRYTEAVPPFQLKQGEKKLVANLPVDYIYQMKTDSTPTASDCLSAPTPH